ncbi:hypothetical protein BC826DRAFT_1058646 [Russula brevipes]|nr:hypothetical protein BC826DRAFT_1058646 [Russula brevipes]
MDAEAGLRAREAARPEEDETGPGYLGSVCLLGIDSTATLGTEFDCSLYNRPWLCPSPSHLEEWLRFWWGIRLGKTHSMKGLINTGSSGLRNDAVEKLQKLLQGNFCVVVLRWLGLGLSRAVWRGTFRVNPREQPQELLNSQDLFVTVCRGRRRSRTSGPDFDKVMPRNGNLVGVRIQESAEKSALASSNPVLDLCA